MAALVPSWPAPPELWPSLERVLEAGDRIGKDANGGHLFLEREGWLDRNGVTDVGEREAFHRLWDAALGAQGRAFRALTRERHDR